MNAQPERRPACRRQSLAFLALVGLALATAACAAADPGGEVAPVERQELRIVREGSILRVPYCRTSQTGGGQPILRLLIVIHGDQRNACEYAGWAADAASRAGQLDETLVVAPQFPTEDDNLADDVLYWRDDGWKAGANSRDDPHDRPWRIPSFAVVDELIVRSMDSLPNLQEVVVAGHSAGGQFVQRYAAGTRILGPIRFVVANPSSYLYLTAERWIDGALGDLSDGDIEECPNFDDYKYGLQDRYRYFDGLSDDEIRRRYGDRRIDYLLGADDSATEGGNLDESCEAGWQGESRRERGERFVDAIKRWYADPEVHRRHRLTVVPQVGHDAEGMFTSEEGQRALVGGS